MTIDDVFGTLLVAWRDGASVTALLYSDNWLNGPVQDVNGKRAIIGGRVIALEHIKDIEILSPDCEHHIADELLDQAKALRDLSGMTLAEQMIARVKDKVE